MFKKLALILIAFVLVIGALQLWGGRDFTQVSLVLDKYNQNKQVGTLLSDIATIFKGERVKDSIIPSKDFNRIYYRWVDESGAVQYSESRPKVKDFEEVYVKDLPFNVEPSLTKEEMEDVK